MSYQILKVTAKDLKQTTVATGKIEPRDEVEIKPQISGIISEVYKEAGQTVRKGEVIAKVKVIPELGTLNSAESRVRLAEMNGKQAETNLQRMEKLYNDKLVSSEEYEQTLLAAQQAREELQAAKRQPRNRERRHHQEQRIIQQHTDPLYHRRTDSRRADQSGKFRNHEQHVQ